MADNKNSGAPPDNRERRKKTRRLGKERRDQARWDLASPLRRKGPGRRSLDRLLQALELLKK